MDNSQLSSYTARIASSSQAQTIEIIQRTLSAQSGLFDGGLTILGSATLLSEFQNLLDEWASETDGYCECDVFISAEASKSSVCIAAADEIIVNASEIVRGISLDWDSFNRSQALFNDEKLEIPIKIQQEAHRSVGDITLISYQTISATISGDKESISAVMAVLGEKGLTPEKISVADAQLVRARIDPQKIKLHTDYACLVINGIEIPFRENSLQMNLLCAMFGKRGKNRVKLEFDVFYEIWAEEQNTQVSWESYADRDVFIKQLRNTTAAINDKIRKATGGTENFLEIRNNAIRINPNLLNPKK